MTGGTESAERLLELHGVDLARRLVASLARRDDSLRRLLMLAAVPYRVDRELLERLSTGLIQPGEFDRAYDALRGLSYLKEAADHTFTLHDDLRLPLLELWDAGEVEDTSLADVRVLVRDAWDERYLATCRAEVALDTVSGIIRSTSPRRFTSVYRSVHRRMEHTLAHGMVAAVAADPDEARLTLGRRLDERGSRREYSQCDLLSRAFVDAVATLPDDDQRTRLHAWAAYYRARTAADLHDWASADQWLDKAQPHAEQDPILALWVAAQRESILADQNLYEDARVAAEELVRLNDESHADRWNEHVAHSELAQIHHMCWRPDEAMVSLRRAIDSATDAGNSTAVIACRLNFATMATDDDAAVVEVLRAVVEARLQDFSAATNGSCVRAALQVLGWRSARLTAVLSQELRQLTRGQGPHALIDLFEARSQVFSKAALPFEAWDAIQEAIREASEFTPERLPDLQASRAALGDEVGHARESAAENLAVLADPIGHLDTWLRARCLTNAALSLLEVTEGEQAWELAEQARPLFAEMGNERAAAYMGVIQAESYRIRGDLERARAALDQVDVSLPWNFELMHGKVALRLRNSGGERSAAGESAANLWAHYLVNGDPNGLAMIGADVLRGFQDATRYDEAAQVAREIGHAADTASAFAAWAPTEKTAAADAHVAEGLRIWKAGIGHERMRLRSAREHCAEALLLDPDMWWIHLEAGLIERAAQDPESSERALDRAASLIDDPTVRRAFDVVRAGLD